MGCREQARGQNSGGKGGMERGKGMEGGCQECLLFSYPRKESALFFLALGIDSSCYNCGGSGVKSSKSCCPAKLSLNVPPSWVGSHGGGTGQRDWNTFFLRA